MGKKRLKSKVNKLQKKRNRIIYIIAAFVVGIFILTVGTMAMLVSDEIKEIGPPPEQDKEPHLMVEDVFFMQSYGSYGSRARASNEWLDLVATVYVTNDGLAAAEDVKIVAFPIDRDKNLALDKVDTIVGEIPTQETSEIEFVITVPSGSRHNVNLLVFERNRLILRGSGSVVIQGSYTNTQGYKTEEVRGTVNDTDYDGMADSWERYYGLDPTDGTDAKKDNDGDGASNLAEYIAGTEPCEPFFGDEDSDDLDSMGTGIIGIIAFIIIIIIILVIIAFASKSASPQDKFKSSDEDKPAWTGQQTYNNSYQLPNWHKPPARCLKCGGWVINDTCTTCSTKYPAPVTNQSENAPKTTQMSIEL